jgi:hypothetical protein
VLLPKLLGGDPSTSCRCWSVQGVEISLTPIAGLYGTRNAMNKRLPASRGQPGWPGTGRFRWLMCALLISQHRL